MAKRVEVTEDELDDVERLEDELLRVLDDEEAGVALTALAFTISRYAALTAPDTSTVEAIEKTLDTVFAGVKLATLELIRERQTT